MSQQFGQLRCHTSFRRRRSKSASCISWLATAEWFSHKFSIAGKQKSSTRIWSDVLKRFKVVTDGGSNVVKGFNDDRSVILTIADEEEMEEDEIQEDVESDLKGWTY
uniref:Uncharacterized protein n=1 Tax=Ditylenchus dipsaci TaxID=166011 RepID=A0A915EGV8_9BILA